VIATAIYFAIERPLAKARRRLTYRRRAEVPARVPDLIPETRPAKDVEIPAG
jgi:hypothetical protein